MGHWPNSYKDYLGFIQKQINDLKGQPRWIEHTILLNLLDRFAQESNEIFKTGKSENGQIFRTLIDEFSDWPEKDVVDYWQMYYFIQNDQSNEDCLEIKKLVKNTMENLPYEAGESPYVSQVAQDVERNDQIKSLNGKFGKKYFNLKSLLWQKRNRLTHNQVFQDYEVLESKRSSVYYSSFHYERFSAQTMWQTTYSSIFIRNLLIECVQKFFDRLSRENKNFDDYRLFLISQVKNLSWYQGRII